MPDIQDDDDRGQSEPLEGVAVMLLDVGGQRGRAANESVGGRRPDRPAAPPRAAAGRGPSRGRRRKIEILPDRDRWSRSRTRRASAGAGRPCPRPSTRPGGVATSARRRPVGEVARQPAALDEDGTLPSSSAIGVTTTKPTRPSIGRLSRNTVRSGSQRPLSATRGTAASRPRRRRGRATGHRAAASAARVQRCLPLELLRRAIELPQAHARPVSRTPTKRRAITKISRRIDNPR